MRRFFIALLLTFGLPLAAHAQFYVCASNCFSPSGAAVTPSDSNNGTSLQTPFLTIGKAQTSMQGGSTKKTYIEAGTYTMGTTQFTGSGNWNFTSSDNGETWASYGGDAVTISGGASPSVNGFIPNVASGTQNLTIKGLTFINTGGSNGTHSGSTGAGFSIAGNLTTAQNILLQYNTFKNCSDYCVFMYQTNGVTIDSNHCQNVTGAGINLGSCFGSWASAGTDGGSINLTASHNLCENMYYGCVDFNGSQGAITMHDVTIDSNVVVNGCQKITILSDSDCGSIYISDRSGQGTNIKITNNVVMGPNLDILDSNTMVSKGIYLDDCASNVTISGNLLFNNVGLWPVFLHGSQHVAISNNVFVLASGGSSGAELAGYQTNFAGRCPDVSTMAGNTFQNNAVWLQGNYPNNGPWETGGSSPTNGPTISNNLYYVQTGATYRNTITGTNQYIDAAPIFCGPSMGPSPLGNISPQKLWTLLANGTISSWQQIATNQGPTVRGCAAGQF